MQHIVSFSGGKDSTAMLLMMIERGCRIDRIVNVDTTKEFPEMLHHIDMVREMVSPLKIETIKMNFDYWFRQHIKTKGKRIGEVGYSWPDFKNRWCTKVKGRAFTELAKHSGRYVEYHWISYDEAHRTKRNARREIRWPLVDWRITGADALKYCYSRGLTWGGLYEKFSRVSCWCCPLARIGEIETIYRDFPELWSKMLEMDKWSRRRFKSRYTLADLDARFSRSASQLAIN